MLQLTLLHFSIQSASQTVRPLQPTHFFLGILEGPSAGSMICLLVFQQDRQDNSKIETLFLSYGK